MCSSTVREKRLLIKGNKQALFWKFEAELAAKKCGSGSKLSILGAQRAPKKFR